MNVRKYASTSMVRVRMLVSRTSTKDGLTGIRPWWMSLGGRPLVTISRVPLPWHQCNGLYKANRDKVTHAAWACHLPSLVWFGLVPDARLVLRSVSPLPDPWSPVCPGTVYTTTDHGCSYEFAASRLPAHGTKYNSSYSPGTKHVVVVAGVAVCEWVRLTETCFCCRRCCSALAQSTDDVSALVTPCPSLPFVAVLSNSRLY